jgi:hypothetical protein
MPAAPTRDAGLGGAGSQRYGLLRRAGAEQWTRLRTRAETAIQHFAYFSMGRPGTFARVHNSRCNTFGQWAVKRTPIKDTLPVRGCAG